MAEGSIGTLPELDSPEDTRLSRAGTGCEHAQALVKQQG